MKVRWLSRASTDISDMIEYLSAENPKVATEQLTIVTEAAGRLADNPAIGRPGRVPDTRELIVSRYVIAYRVKDSNIQILRVLHQSRKWPKHF